MAAITQENSSYLAGLAQLDGNVPRSDYPWLSSIRRQAAERFAEIGFPTTREEAWRHTSVAAIASASFPPALPGGNGVSAGILGNFLFGDTECCNLVFVNGFLSPELSTPGALPKGVRAGSLALALRSEPGKIEPYLARHADFRASAFTALNTAFMLDGGFIWLPPETALQKIIHLIFVSTAAGRGKAS